MSTPAINIVNLSIGYSGKPLFRPFSLEIPQGSLTVMVGANGTGKSTLLHTLAGSLPAVSGRIFIHGEDLRALSFRRKARLISLTYTERLLSGGLTVKELVEMGRQPYTGFMGHLSQEDNDIVTDALDMVGIAHKCDSFLSDISDGERQKVMIARALAQQTPVMLFDEPTNFLDAASRLEILHLIRDLVNRNSITAVLSGHDIAPMLAIADHVVTVLPENVDNVAGIAMHPAGSIQATERLDTVFADRGIRFSPDCNDFIFKC